MSERKINKQHQATFDGIRHVDDAGNEYWLARQLSKVLEYSQYRHFVPVLDRAREAGRNSGQRMEDHMEDILTMVDIGSGAQREVDDVRLSRYACYLIVQNGDPAKPVIANGQTYFAAKRLMHRLSTTTMHLLDVGSGLDSLAVGTTRQDQPDPDHIRNIFGL